MAGKMKRYMYLKSRTILSKPTRKPDSVSSFAVVVHSILMLKKWHRIAFNKWYEIPPKNSRNMGVHFAVSTSDQKKVVWPRRCRNIAYAVGESTLKITAIPTKIFQDVM